MTDFESFRSRIEGHSGKEFIENLEKICDELHNVLNILNFGMLVYDETNPEFRKILRDKDYWDALEKASGDKMVIFSLADKLDVEIVDEPISEGDARLEFMTSFKPSHRTKSKSYSRLIKSIFNDEGLLVYPSVIFFQVMDKEVCDYTLVPLKRKDVWASAKAIQDLFASISIVLNNILPEYYGNQKEIFDLVIKELQRQKFTMYLLKGPKALSDLIGIIRNIFWL